MDSEAVNALAGPDSFEKRRVRRFMEAAERTGRDVVVATIVLAEMYRGSQQTQRVDALLARTEGALNCRDTDRRLARLVGGVLHAGGAGSEDIVDGHVVAVTVEAGGGVILTGDIDDLERLAAPYRTIMVEGLRHSSGSQGVGSSSLLGSTRKSCSQDQR
ncbi:MAG: VapC toxin family PIN domain ribonuclease [Acidimicrobiales bacterium]